MNKLALKKHEKLLCNKEYLRSLVRRSKGAGRSGFCPPALTWLAFVGGIVACAYWSRNPVRQGLSITLLCVWSVTSHLKVRVILGWMGCSSQSLEKKARRTGRVS